MGLFAAGAEWTTAGRLAAATMTAFALFALVFAAHSAALLVAWTVAAFARWLAGSPRRTRLFAAAAVVVVAAAVVALAAGAWR